MGKKEFPVPVLDEEKWKELQEYLNIIHKSASIAEDSVCTSKGSKEEFTADEKIILGCLEKIQICLGWIDHILGREYSFEEVMEELKVKYDESQKDDETKTEQ